MLQLGATPMESPLCITSRINEPISGKCDIHTQFFYLHLDSDNHLGFPEIKV